MANVGLDVDGVIYNYVKSLREYIHVLNGTPLEMMPDALGWNFMKDQWNLTMDQYYKIVTMGIKHDDFLKTGDKIEGCKEAIDYIYHVRKDRITLVTARDFGGIEDLARAATIHWLQDNEIPYHELILTHQKVGFNFDVIFDDSPGNVEQIRAAGENAVVFTQPWNAEMKDVPRVHGWDGVLNYLEENFPIQVDKAISAE